MHASAPRCCAVVVVSSLALIAACTLADGPTGVAPISMTSSFSSTGSGASSRAGHAGVVLGNGTVLVAGGITGITRVATAELYDPLTGTWSAAPNMTFARYGHAAVALADGRALVVGGVSFNSCADQPVSLAAEIFDPAPAGGGGGTWSRAGNMSHGRSAPAAVLLADGRVLVAGGGNRCGAIYRSADIYDPATGTWSPTGEMNEGRQAAAAVRLADGRVLVAGGFGASPFASLASAELYDPASGTWSLTGPMWSPRLWTSDEVQAADALVLLADGRAFTAGGGNRRDLSSSPVVLASAEVFDPAGGAWSIVGSLATARMKHRMAVLPMGGVVVTGGQNGSVVGGSEVFDPSTGVFSGAGPLVTARFDHTSSLLADGRVLLAMGNGASGGLSSAEIFTFNAAPVADAGPAASGAEGASLAFSGSASVDPDGGELTYRWDFGDGSPDGTGVDVTHTYADNGTFTVTLWVSDGTDSSSATTTATVRNVAPTVSLILGTDPVSTGQVFTASGSFTDPGADVWTALVGYGDAPSLTPLELAGNGFSLSHVYAVPGTFTITVILTDDDGGVGVAQGEVRVVSSNRAPVANAGDGAAGHEGAAVTFDGTASSDPDGDALTYEWDFGDGTSAAGVVVQHVYADNGSYAVTLTVSDGSLSDIATVAAVIANVAPLVGAFDGAELLPGDLYRAGGSFADPGADQWSATVDYGDGTGTQPLALSGTSFGLSHTYFTAGTFTVTVTVTDDDGGAGVSRATVVVNTLQGLVGEIDQGVEELQASGALNPPTANSLAASLDAAIAKLDAGDYDGALNNLEVFISKVDGLVKNGRLSAEAAAPLLEQANRLVAILRAIA